MKHRLFWLCCLATVVIGTISALAQETARLRAHEMGIRIGVLPTGPLNTITDVAGVLVGQTTIVRGDNIRTGVTAILPHGGNLFREKVPGAVFIGNAFGKLAGSTQVNELGEIETPILLTCTLCVPRAADALIDYMLALQGNEDVMSVNPLVGETNDGYLNDIRQRPISRDDVFAAIKGARRGPVEEGPVGAGTGTRAFGFKGGIGTASRKLPQSLGGYTVGVLVQTNFGGVLSIAGAPVGKELGSYYLRDEIEPVKPINQMNGASLDPVVPKEPGRHRDDANGSCGCHGRASGRTQPEALGIASDHGYGADRFVRRKRQRRFCDCLLYGGRVAHCARTLCGSSTVD